MRSFIRNGGVLPPVAVFEQEEGFYLYDSFRGGHHRSIAYILEESPMPVEYDPSLTIQNFPHIYAGYVFRKNLNEIALQLPK